MEQLQVVHGALWVYSFRFEGHCWPYCLGRVDEVQRRTKQSRQRIREGEPSRIRPAIVSLLSDLRACDICLLVIILSVYPCPDLHTCASLSSPARGSCAPTLVIPSPQTEPQV